MRALFIGGCSRSGTTLLGSLLGAHSQCIVTPESQFKIACMRALSGDVTPSDRRRAVDEMRHHPRFKLWKADIDPEMGRQQADSPRGLLSWVVREYARSRGKSEADIWIDHTGTNSRYAARLLKEFPEARFIHLVRDGRGVAASVMPLDWGPNTVHRAAHWWTERICFGLAAESCLQSRALRVRFEDIVNFPEEKLREVCDFMEVSYEATMLAGDGFDVPKFTRAQHQLVGERPDPTRATAWKSLLSDREIEVFESLTGDLLVDLGYETAAGAWPAPVRWHERIRAYGVEGIRGVIINRVRHRNRMRRSINESSHRILENPSVISGLHAYP